MNKCLIIGALLAMLPFSAYAGEKNGGIRGQVNYCGKGGVEGMTVFIPGRQFVVMTDQTGKFLFQQLPVGSYDLHYMLDGQLLNFNRDIQVRAGRTLDLAEMAFCRDSQQSSVNSAEHPAGKLNSGPDLAPPQGSVNTASPQSDCQAGSTLAQCQDNDKDGVIAQQDCDDADPNTRPGALEKCDGRDNNCNGIVDDVNEFYMTHAIGRCENGKKTIKQCDRGFADCDGDPTNGCEININKDAENCGACGNSCSDLETCQLGIC